MYGLGRGPLPREGAAMEQAMLLKAVVRSLGGAWRALRLYPASSQITRTAAERACAEVSEYLQAEPTLNLDVVRGGFILRGIEGVLTAPGVPDLADALAAHGVGEVHFIAPPTPDDVLALLSVALERPHEVQEHGGIISAMHDARVTTLRVIPIRLAKVEAPPEIPEEEADKFLAELAADASRLAVWLRSLLASDDEGLAEGILTLAAAAEDVRVFGRTLAVAFLELDTDSTDRMLEAAIDILSIEHVVTEMLENLSGLELVSIVRGGKYGANLSALSYALTSLPAKDRQDEFVKEAEDALRAADAGDSDIAFLRRMYSARAAAAEEPSVVDRDPLYPAMVRAIALSPDQVQFARGDATSRQGLDASIIETLEHLLDTASDLRSYSRTLHVLARAVSWLIEAGDPALALAVARGVSRRAATSGKPWPELSSEFARAAEEMSGSRSMAGLIAMSAEDGAAGAEHAKELVTLGGESAARALAGAAIASDAENGIEFALSVLGRRLPELLAPEVSRIDESNAAKLAELFARDGGPRCIQALGQLVAREEDRVRSEVARGIGAGGGHALSAYMPRLLRDESQSVALVTVRALARNGGPGTMEMLAQALSQLDGDKDIRIAREIIDAFAASDSDVAEAALKELAEKGSFIRRSRYAETKRLAREALEARRTREGA